MVWGMEPNERWDAIWSEKSRLTAGWIGGLLARDVIHRTVWGILRREIPNPQGLRILEPGSGSGLVSLALARRGAEVYLLDISTQAVRFSKAFFAKERATEATVQASIIHLPFKDNVFDATWNAGVIEHFKQDEQATILNEMLRVTKPGGKVIVIAPSSQGRIYRLGKTYADRHASWQPGYEVPVVSLRHLAARTGGKVIREYRTGFLAEFHFLKYYFAGARPLRLAWCGLVELVSLVLFPMNRLPGYLLVTVLAKEASPDPEPLPARDPASRLA
jgi:SAM-dependent methyltransferase